MIIQSRQDAETGKTYINITLTQEELKELIADRVISIEDTCIQCQIVAEAKE